MTDGVRKEREERAKTKRTGDGEIGGVIERKTAERERNGEPWFPVEIQKNYEVGGVKKEKIGRGEDKTEKKERKGKGWY